MASHSGTRSTRGSRRRATVRKEAASGFLYIETSALLAALLEKDAARNALHAAQRRVTSALTFAEAARALVRARVAQRLKPSDERAGLRWLRSFRRRCDVVAITDAVIARAGRPFPMEPIRTLDAIHIATAESLGEPPQLISILSRDARVIDNARALGYVVE